MTLPDLGASLPEIVLRTAVVYLFLVAVMRIRSVHRLHIRVALVSMLCIRVRA